VSLYASEYVFSLSISSSLLSSRDYIDSEAGGPVNPSQNDPSLILRVYLHYRYNCTLRFKPRSLSLIGDKLRVNRPDLGRAFAGMCDQNDPLLNRYIEQNQ